MRSRVLAFYLPQFHPIPENDLWWGPGFTEWTSAAAARPLFRGHLQPHLPADLGFYDLRLPDSRHAQAELARTYGIDGFCYYHYWFAGRRLLERPFHGVLSSGEPDFPFCLCWANENWTRRWDGRDDEVLIAQRYSEGDDRAHARWLCTAFRDSRYVRFNGRPVFLVYRATHLPDPRRTTSILREEAIAEGIGELHLCAVQSFDSEHRDPRPMGFDAAVEFQPDWGRRGTPRRPTLPERLFGRLGIASPPPASLRIFDYAALVEASVSRSAPPYPWYRCITPGWDNTPRRGADGVVFVNSHPERYSEWLSELTPHPSTAHGASPFLFINAWNEWGEGNHLEPCQHWGRRYLEETRKVLSAARPLPDTGPSVSSGIG